MSDEAFDFDDKGQAAAKPSAVATTAKKPRAAPAVDFGRVDSLRHSILSFVHSESYERAIEELNIYIANKKEYPTFEPRVSRFQAYCVDLINAIKAKRSFPGLNVLSMAKQQEIYDRVMHHMVELADALKRIENIEREIKLDDKRSTVWVLRALVHSVILILIVALVMELSKGVLSSLGLLADDYFMELTSSIFEKLGF